jgi:hypothetical protein
MDERSDRITHLKHELSSFPIPNNFHIETPTGEFAYELGKLLDDLDAKGLQLAPTFAFLDPFGFSGLPFTLVRRLLANSKSEVLVNVMADAINRFLEHPDRQIRRHIVDLFGTEEVLQIAQTSRERVAELRHLYQRQLSTCARFVRYFEMRNCNGRTVYYLFFASNHPLGHVKMKEAFWKVDPASGFCFSDATNPQQLVLFEMDGTPTLAADLAKTFGQRKVPVEEVRRYVEDATSYVSTHMRGALRLLENDGKMTASEYKLDGSKRRNRTYPDDVVVAFT